VEADDDTHALFVNGEQGNVGVGNTATQGEFSVTTGGNNGSGHTTGIQVRHNGYSGYKSGMTAGDTADTTHSCGFIGFEGGGHGNSGQRSIVFETRPGDTDIAPIQRMKIHHTGEVTMPTQSAFLAKPASAQNNLATGNTTLVLGDEIFDQNADFNVSNYTFTAPVTGKYQLNVYVRLQAVDTGASYYHIYLVTSNRTYFDIIQPVFTADPTYMNMAVNVLADMDANDTAKVSIYQAAGTQQTDLGQANDSHFSGYLVC
jgi:hypothetical protein